MQTYSRKTHILDLVREHADPEVLWVSSFVLVDKVIWFSIDQLPYYIFLEQLLSEKTPNEVLSKEIRVLYKSIIIFFLKNVFDRIIIPVTRQRNILVSMPMLTD